MPPCSRQQTLSNKDSNCTVHLLLPVQNFIQKKISAQSRDDITIFVNTTLGKTEKDKISNAQLFAIEGGDLKHNRDITDNFYYDLNPQFAETNANDLASLQSLNSLQSEYISPGEIGTMLQNGFDKYKGGGILAALALALIYIAASDDPSVYMPDWLHELRSTSSPLKQAHQLTKWFLEERDKDGAPIQGPRPTKTNPVSPPKKRPFRRSFDESAQPITPQRSNRDRIAGPPRTAKTRRPPKRIVEDDEEVIL